MMTAGTFENWRAYYSAIGLTVIPTHGIINGVCRCEDGPLCQSAGKHPRGAYKRGNTPIAFRDGDNIAVLTDPLVIIDIDYDGLDEVVDELQLPETFTVKTNHGYHLWYRADPDTPCKSVTGVLPKVDVRAIGGIVVVPPSRTAVGGTYDRIRGTGPVPVPAHLLERLPKKSDDRERLAIVQSNSVADTPDKYSSMIEEQVIAVLSSGKGNRNGALFQAACRIAEYHAFGFAGDDAFVALRLAADSIGLSRTESENTINSARYEILEG